MLARNLYNHSRYFALVVLVILAVGYASLQSIARQEDPSLTSFIAVITTYFPGAEPARVEALISKPLEDALREIPELDDIYSTSTTGVSVVTVVLDETLSKTELEQT